MTYGIWSQLCRREIFACVISDGLSNVEISELKKKSEKMQFFLTDVPQYYDIMVLADNAGALLQIKLLLLFYIVDVPT